MATSILLVAFFVSRLVLILCGATTWAISKSADMAILAGWWPVQVLIGCSILWQAGSLWSSLRDLP